MPKNNVSVFSIKARVGTRLKNIVIISVKVECYHNRYKSSRDNGYRNLSKSIIVIHCFVSYHLMFIYVSYLYRSFFSTCIQQVYCTFCSECVAGRRRETKTQNSEGMILFVLSFSTTYRYKQIFLFINQTNNWVFNRSM